MAPVHQNVDFSNLSDEELSQMLTDYGVNVGPINDATRSTYERKLARLKTGQPSPHVSQYEPVEDEEEEENVPVDDNDDSEIQFRRPEASSTHRGQPTSGHIASRTVAEPPQARLRRDPPDYRGTPHIDARPGLSSYKRGTATTTQSAPPPQKEGKGLPMWVKLLALLVVVVLVYLIYSNMEPPAVSNIPGIPNKVEV